jgi:NMD protein affecting ribosome stability and mRNA decay
MADREVVAYTPDGRCVVCGSPTDRGDSACGACMTEATAVGERYEEVDL